jgi:hypothetical protein
MEKTQEKIFYNLTLYKLETYYTKNTSYLPGWSDDLLYEVKTWVNHSSYSKTWNQKFFDLPSLKKKIKSLYPKDNSVCFHTDLNDAIKTHTLYSAPRHVIVISSSRSYKEKTICFQLKNMKKKNTSKQKRKNRYFYSSDCWSVDITRKQKDNDLLKLQF